MKFVYFHRCFGDIVSSVDKKIFSQISKLSGLGVNARSIIVCSHAYQAVDNEITQVVQIPLPKTRLFIVDRLSQEYSVNNVLKETIKKLQSGDILYMRIPYPFSFTSRLLKKSRLCKIVIEYQTKEPLEYRMNGKYLYIILDFLFGDAIRRYSDAIVGVTDEITLYQLARSGDPCKPHITIGNGVDVDAVKIRTLPGYPENELHLLCVANVNRWHGIDRLLRGIAEYKGSANVTVHIVGEGFLAELYYLRTLAKDLDIEGNVVFHGYLTGNALDELFDSCHIAVGSLAIHRKGLIQTSELKVREYCARGIPFIFSGMDPDFLHDDFPYLHTVSADNTSIDIENVQKFAIEILQDSEHPRKMREYAFDYLDWGVKMMVLKEFLTTLHLNQREKII
jgi:glycosyltransferase involved in cell wall biosynthesis